MPIVNLPKVLILAGFGLAACAAGPESGRRLYFENAQVCAEPAHAQSVLATAGSGRQSPSLDSEDLPPRRLLERSAFLTCRAYQRGSIGNANYVEALRDGTRTVILSSAESTTRLRKSYVVGVPGWPQRSPLLRAACEGLAFDRKIGREEARYCLHHFSDLAAADRLKGAADDADNEG